MKTHHARKPLWFKMLSILWFFRSRYYFLGSCFFCLLIVLSSVIPQGCRAAWPTCETTAASQQISFVHVSDTHARYNPIPGGSSPLARVRGFVEQVREENPYTVFTNAGDDYEKGSIAEELSQGRTTRQVVQAMQYDVRTIGNHDFAWGLEELLAFSHDPVAVGLASNTKMTGNVPGRQPGWVDYAELTVGCVKIGFFGFVSRPWNENGEQYDGPFYHRHPELQTDSRYVAITNEIIASHRQEVDLLVLVSHLGIYDDIHLAEQTQGIDIILGGHTHTTMTKPLRINETTIIHAGSHAETVGRFDLDYNLREKQIAGSHFALASNQEGVMPVDAATDQEINKIISSYQEAIHTDFARLNTSQRGLGMALIAARAAVETLKCDAAFVNPQSAWQGRSLGGLTAQDVLDIFPVEREPAGESGSSSLYLIRETGADLLHARASLPDFTYWGPENINPAMIYTVALPKAQALDQKRYFGREVSVAPPDSAGELWEAVVAFGRDRNSVNLSLDERGQDRSRDLIAALVKGR
ncbi:MAG: metallophosphoesterase [Desulfocapsaceae bacterium]|nr:metallophosphoesterase [Desulfocapsaceae bacterium]